MIFTNHKKRGTRDYAIINKYLGPQKPGSKPMRFTKKDAVYILLSGLIILGLSRGVASLLKGPTEYAMSKLETQEVLAKDAPITSPTPEVVYVPLKDDRAEKLEAFLTEKDSPFAHLASYIVEKSDENGIDYTLIASISGKESTFGKYSRCYNAWGLGGRDFMCFQSWEESIDFTARLLGKHYRENMIAGIQPKYCPSFECASDWVAFVTSSSEEILEK